MLQCFSCSNTEALFDINHPFVSKKFCTHAQVISVVRSVLGSEMTSAYKMHTRDSIRRRLGTMDTQIDAIEAMANNMEDEFRSTHVVSAGSAFWVVHIDITVDTSMNTSVDTSVDTCSFLLLAAAEHDRSDRREHPTCK